MKKNTKKTIIIISCIIGVLFIASIGYLLFNKKGDVADITNSGSSSNLFLKFYDSEGNVVGDLNDLKSQSFLSQTIVKGTSPQSCSIRTQCPNYATNPNILCWNGQCVLGNVASMDMGVQIENPSSSQVTFNNVKVITASPSALNTAINKSTISSLVPGQSVSLGTTSPISVTSFAGTTQTFSINVQGTNSYTGQVNDVTASSQLVFASDPTGSLNVGLISPI